jgi:predicted PilT family ATPase
MDLTKIKQSEESSMKKHAKESVSKILKSKGITQFSIEFESENRILLKVPDEQRAEIIGKGGARIDQLEKEVGFSITLASLSESQDKSTELREIYYSIRREKHHIEIAFNEPVEYVEILTPEGDLISSNAVGRKNNLKLKRKTPQGKLLDTMVMHGEPLVIRGK